MATTSPKSKSPEGDSPKSSKSDQRPEGLSSAIIEVAPAGEAEEGDDFETASFDVASTASTSVQSSVYQHSYENGRRVRSGLRVFRRTMSGWLTAELCHATPVSPIPPRPVPDSQ